MCKKSKFSTLLRLISFLFLATFSANSMAATATGLLSVNAVVLNTCLLGPTSLAPILNFNNIADVSVAQDADVTIQVACTTDTDYDISLGQGLTGDYTERKMTGLTGEFGYNLYTSAARDVVWGDGSGATDIVSGTGAGILSFNDHTIYGRTSSVTGSLPAEAYVDEVIITVTY